MEDKKLNCVLLVDDDAITNFINQRLLKKLNVSNEVVITSSGDEGLAFIREFSSQNNEHSPDLILLDVNMPGMKGADFLKAFNAMPLKNKDQVQILILSASPDAVKGNVSTFGRPYLTKPLTVEKIQKALQR